MPAKVLIACYHFPPDAAVGALRPARFARALPRFGWQPYVLTVRDEDRSHVDCTRLAGLDEVPVVKTRELPSLWSAFLQFRTRLRTTVDHQRVADSRSAAEVPSRDARETFAEKIKRHIISLIVLLPDDKKGWALYSAFRAVILIRQHNIQCLVTSGPPASIHVVGLIAKALTSVRWIADFRDPWVDSIEARAARARSNASDAIERRMERTVVTRADRVITTTEILRQVLLQRYPTLAKNKVQCVPNGIDTLPVSANDDKYLRLTITYAGTLYEGRTPEPLFVAVRDLIRDGEIDAAAIRIKLVGNCASIDGIDTRALANRYGLGQVVEVLPFVPQSEAIRVMRKSHLLLVLAPAHHRLIVPAKLYDYLASGSMILALAEPGAAADFVRETNSGRCISCSDVDGLRDFLRDLIRNKSTLEQSDRSEWLERYDPIALTGRLAAEMSALCSMTPAAEIAQ